MSEEEEEEGGEKEGSLMPLTGHLEELRTRLLHAVAAVAIFFVLSLFVSDRLMRWFARPLSADLIFLSPAEAFWGSMKVSFFFSLVLSSPVIFYEVWRFVAPGLFPHERRTLLPFVLTATLLFALGLLFCYSVVLPFALDFLIQYGVAQGLTPQISVGLYIDFTMKFLLAFGAIFELPLLITLLVRLGLLTPRFLKRNRRYAVLGAFISAAILTPTPDAFNQCLMALPLILLYEVGIISAQIFGGETSLSGGRSRVSSKWAISALVVLILLFAAWFYVEWQWRGVHR